MLFSRWNNEVILKKIRVLLNVTIDMVEILLFWVVHFLLRLSVFTYFIEKLDSIVFQTIILLIVIFAEIAWVAFEHNVMKKKMIAYR